jgi:hypothetical protein
MSLMRAVFPVAVTRAFMLCGAKKRSVGLHGLICSFVCKLSKEVGSAYQYGVGIAFML